jgi:hypothetical protein
VVDDDPEKAAEVSAQEGPASAVVDQPSLVEPPTAEPPAEEPSGAASEIATPEPLAEVVDLPQSPAGESPEPAKQDTTSNVSPAPTPPLEQELSVAPGKTLLPDDRPNWITLEPDYSTDTHRLVVSSIPTARRDDTESNLDAPLEEALRNYVCEQFDDEHAGRLLENRLSAAFIRTNLIDDKLSYTAELSTSGGEMYQKWVMVEVTKEQRQQLQTWYREQVQRERILPLGVGVVGLLGLIGLLNLGFRKVSRNKPTIQPLKVAQVDEVVNSPICCSKKSKWGLAFVIAIAIAVAVFSG